ncbi:hypothetical protein B0H16DRAFT_1460480 [Mycena metata]|uniref:Uncharacterized protein n=1 Tax=Mycena metata TaxID=1033252 RepID=A0AAD7IV47_9AGAR|nr:hypothetical protein B0H16DRAFT_1460480 [Mycena metata]
MFSMKPLVKHLSCCRHRAHVNYLSRSNIVGGEARGGCLAEGALGEVRVLLNEVALDPGSEGRLSKAVMDPGRAAARAARKGEHGHEKEKGGSTGWKAPYLSCPWGRLRQGSNAGTGSTYSREVCECDKKNIGSGESKRGLELQGRPLVSGFGGKRKSNGDALVAAALEMQSRGYFLMLSSLLELKKHGGGGTGGRREPLLVVNTGGAEDVASPFTHLLRNLFVVEDL